MLLNYERAAEWLSISESSLKALVAERRITVTQVMPCRVAFDVADLQAYADARKRPAINGPVAEGAAS